MPIHDWTRVEAGLFHAFHQQWIISLSNALNLGVLPSDYFALIEQSIRGPVPDALTLHLSSTDDAPSSGAARAVPTAPPRARIVSRSEEVVYSRKADRLTVRHRRGDIVAVIEIVSPGNKGSKSELKAFVEKMAALIQRGIHALMIDVFPPTPRDPFGIHGAIWDEFLEEDFATLPGKPLIVAAYDPGASANCLRGISRHWRCAAGCAAVLETRLLCPDSTGSHV